MFDDVINFDILIVININYFMYCLEKYTIYIYQFLFKYVIEIF